MSKFTVITDMHSGGGKKTEFWYHIVMLPEAQAIAWFEHHYKVDFNRVSCDCCGSDFSAYEYGIRNFEQITQTYGGRRSADTLLVTLGYIRATSPKFYATLGSIEA